MRRAIRSPALVSVAGVVHGSALQRCPAGALNRCEDRALVAEAHLTLGGVHVDVHVERIDGDTDAPRRGIARAGTRPRYASATAATRARLCTRRPLTTTTRPERLPRCRRGSLIAPPTLMSPSAATRQQLCRLGPEDAAQGVVEPASRRTQPGAAVDNAGDAQLWLDQRKVADNSQRGRDLGALAAEETQPRRRGGEEVEHLHGRPGRTAPCPLLHRLAVAHTQRGRRRAAPASREREGHVGHRRDAGQRLAAEPQRGHGLEVGGHADLRGGVARQARRSWAAGIPVPLSTTLMRTVPAESTATSMLVAPASTAFSHSSLTTEAGRSTTSPAAMASATAWGRRWIGAGEDGGAGRGHGAARSRSSASLLSAASGVRPSMSSWSELGDHGVLRRRDAEAELVGGVAPGPRDRPLALEVGEQLAGTHQHRRGNAGEAGDVDAVGAVGSTGDDAVQEGDAVALFENVDARVVHARQLFGEDCQLVVVGGEEGAAVEVRRLVEVLDHRLGDRHAVVRRRAAADLVEDDQAASGGLAEDRGGLGHLHHERRQPPLRSSGRRCA